MRKLLKKISDWWNYTILKKDHDEIVVVYGQGVNKKNVPYYYKDTFNVFYNGNRILNKIRIARVFINKQEFDAHSEQH